MPKRKTKAEEKAERAARAEALRAAFKANCKDPEHPLYDDPIWNPTHRLAARVTELIEKEGMLGGFAERRARWEEAADIIAEGVKDGSLPEL